MQIVVIIEMKKENARNATNAGLRDTSKETVPN